MARPDAAPTPFQFGLRSLFLAVTAIAAALGLLKWIGPCGFVAVVFSTGPFVTAIAILVRRRKRLALIWFLAVLAIGIACLLVFPSLMAPHR
jgi:hypothetical protein